LVAKTAKQTGQCIKFMFTNIEECKVLIKDKQKIKLMEKRTINGNYQFQFFKSSEYLQAKKLDSISVKHYTDQAECNKLHAADTDIIYKRFKT
jgi:hypothetical protein